MSQKAPFDATAYLDLMAPLTGIPIAPEWRAGVEAHLRVAARMAERLVAVPVDDNSIDLACRFIPGSPPPPPATEEKTP